MRKHSVDEGIVMVAGRLEVEEDRAKGDRKKFMARKDDDKRRKR